MKEFKEIQDTKMFVFIVDREWINGNGEICRKGHWEHSTEKVNIGSMKKPNKRILAVKWQLQNPLNNMFGGLFRGL